MNLVTINTGHIVEGVFVAAPVHPGILGVAPQADGRSLSRRDATRFPHIGETDDLCGISVIFNVDASGSMAGLTAFMPFDLEIGQPAVNRSLELVHEVFMAVGTGLSPLIRCSLDCHRHLNHRLALPFHGSASPHDHRHRYDQGEYHEGLNGPSFHEFLLRFAMTNLLPTPVATNNQKTRKTLLHLLSSM